MSIAYETIGCTNCDYEVGSHILWGESVYEMQILGTVRIKKRLGWCDDCATLVPLEDLRPRKLDSNKATDNNLNGIVADIAKKHTQLHQNLIGIKLITSKTQRQEFLRQSNALGAVVCELQACLCRSAEEERFNNVITTRKSQAKCLNCSSSKIFFCDLLNPTADSELIKLDYVHPNCGGKFTVLPNRNRAAIKFTQIRINSSEGIFLREVERISQ